MKNILLAIFLSLFLLGCANKIVLVHVENTSGEQNLDASGSSVTTETNQKADGSLSGLPQL